MVALSPLELSDTSGRLKEVSWSSLVERDFGSSTFRRQANASRDVMVAGSREKGRLSSKWSFKVYNYFPLSKSIRGYSNMWRSKWE